MAPGFFESDVSVMPLTVVRLAGERSSRGPERSASVQFGI